MKGDPKQEPHWKTPVLSVSLTVILTAILLGLALDFHNKGGKLRAVTVIGMSMKTLSVVCLHHAQT